MTGKTHKLGGACVGAIAGGILLESPYTADKMILAGILFSGAIIGSLMPDIDHTGSTIGHKLKLASNIISNLFGHRGITHAPIIHILITVMLLLLGGTLNDFPKLMYISFVIGLFIGGISHLILDSMTIAGIPLLYPFIKKKYRIAKFTTGKHETFVQIILVISTIIIINFII